MANLSNFITKIKTNKYFKPLLSAVCLVSIFLIIFFVLYNSNQCELNTCNNLKNPIVSTANNTLVGVANTKMYQNLIVLNTHVTVPGAMVLFMMIINIVPNTPAVIMTVIMKNFMTVNIVNPIHAPLMDVIV